MIESSKGVHIHTYVCTNKHPTLSPSHIPELSKLIFTVGDRPRHSKRYSRCWRQRFPRRQILREQG